VKDRSGQIRRWWRVSTLAGIAVLGLAGCAQSAGSTGSDAPASAAPAGPASPTRGINAPEHLPAEAVVLISFDGFRHDLFDLHETPTFDRVAESGAMAEGLIPPFPPKTWSSHYTIATGLYPESHGIVGNRFYDPSRREDYAMGNAEAVTDGSWYGGEPIWVTAELQGMVAASYFWIGSEAEIGGARPSYWHTYSNDVPGEEKVDQVLEWLAQPRETRPRVITLYFPEVDWVAHNYPPESPEVGAAVRQVDGYLSRLLGGLALLPEGDRVNLVLVSDHGIAEMPPENTHPMDLSAFPDARVVADGTYASIFMDGSAERVVELQASLRSQLPEEIGVYMRGAIPERLHYSGTQRVGDVVVIPPVGHGVFEPARRPTRTTFTHGWDNAAQEMQGIFIAYGPRIQEGARLRAFESVHIYPFLAELMGLEPREVDGSLEALGSLILDGNSP